MFGKYWAFAHRPAGADPSDADSAATALIHAIITPHRAVGHAVCVGVAKARNFCIHAFGADAFAAAAAKTIALGG